MTPDNEAGMIDLGKTVELPTALGSKGSGQTSTHYPTLNISDIPELDNLPDGEFYFMAKGQVTRHVKETPIGGADGEDSTDEYDEAASAGGIGNSEHCSCEITVIAMKPINGDEEESEPQDSGAKLDATLSEIEKKKADDAEDVADQGADEDTEET